MNDAILGRKVGMTRLFSDSGTSIPATVIEAGPCPITQIKTQDTDGYNAVQLGSGRRRLNAAEQKRKNTINSPLRGHLEKANAIAEIEVEAQDGQRQRKRYGPRYLREIRTDEEGLENANLGDTVDVSIFEEGDLVDVTGTSKGRGFTGVVKRWGFKGGKKTHGGEQDHRRVGSIGWGSSSPSRVHKGKKMPGRHGGKQLTVQNLTVVKSDLERNLLVVKGAVPGPPNGLLIIKKAVKTTVARQE